MRPEANPTQPSTGTAGGHAGDQPDSPVTLAPGDPTVVANQGHSAQGPASPAQTTSSPEMMVVPIWAQAAAGALVLGALVVLAIGRGGTMVLLGGTLLFAALAVYLLSRPDGDPAED